MRIGDVRSFGTLYREPRSLPRHLRFAVALQRLFILAKEDDMSQRRITMCAGFCALALLAPALALAQPAARADWNVGDTWTVAITSSSGVGGAAHREEVRVVKEAGANGYRVENTKKAGGAAPEVEMLTISRDHNFIGPVGGGGAPQEFKWLQWPLEPGRTYQFEINAQNQVTTWKGKVTGWQDVEVPAGKFKALHVEFERSGPFRSSASESIWYAPEAKVIVKRVQTRPSGTRANAYDVTTIVLVAYKLN
jgi:hypothetical protein